MFDILIYGLSVAVVGMATVFLGLIILIGMVKLLEKFVKGEIKDMVVAKLGGTKNAEPTKTSSIPTLDDAELFAVITAAVAAVMEEEAKVVAAAEVKPASFVVRSIRRVNNAPAWNRAGRDEQVYSRM